MKVFKKTLSFCILFVLGSWSAELLVFAQNDTEETAGFGEDKYLGFQMCLNLFRKIELLTKDNQNLNSKMELMEINFQQINETLEKLADTLVMLQQNITIFPKDCSQFNAVHCVNNKCRLQNDIYGSETFLVSCDHETEGGGWTLIQRRINGTIDFYRNWMEYKQGFGNIETEFWIGLDKLHALTAGSEQMELLIQLKDFNDTEKYAKYDNFRIGNETEKFVLKDVGVYSGNAGDSFAYHKGYKFSTKDKDNDINPINCASLFTGAWWYENCYRSNLNGRYYPGGIVPKHEYAQGISWGRFHGYNYSMKSVRMMVRPKRLSTVSVNASVALK